MRIIEISVLDNGAHRNQTGNFSAVPDGWAIIREHENLPNFPFGSFDVEIFDGGLYMKEGSWIPGEMPKPEVMEPEPTTDEILNAMLGV